MKWEEFKEKQRELNKPRDLMTMAECPTWCYILISGHFLIYLADYVLSMLIKRLDKMKEELERKQKLEELGGR